jgi:hypothetical protein
MQAVAAQQLLPFLGANADHLLYAGIDHSSRHYPKIHFWSDHCSFFSKAVC